MNFKNIFPASLLLLAFAAAGSAKSGDKNASREYRPLEAKKVYLQPAGKIDVTSSKKGKEKEALAQAWRHFDKNEWTPAIENFLSALSANPKSEVACEGLAMSIYRSGDYKSAYRLAFELEHQMPRVHYVIEEAVLADVRELVGKDQIAEAQALVKHFPESGTAYAEAHQIVRTTCTITAALQPGQDTTSDPSRFASR